MNAQQLRNSILQEAITGLLVPQDPNDEPASVLLDRIRKEKQQLVKEGKLKKKDLEEKPISEDEIPFEIPESWEWSRIGDIFIHASGKQQSSNNKQIGTLQKYITTSNLYWGYFVLDTLKEMYFSDEELVTCSAQKGDLLVCEGGAGYGRSAIWDKDYDICLQNHVHRLRPIIKGTCEYVYYLIYLLKESNRLASVGTAMPGLSANRLKELFVPLPPLAEQKRIVAKIEGLMPKVEEYGKAQEKLNKLNEELPEKLKKSILQEAIEGRLVLQDPNDEPASALLAKIREEKKQLVKEGKLKKKDLEEKPISEEEIPFEIPESWEWVRLGNVSEIARGGSPRPIKDYLTEAPDGLNWIKIGDTDKGGKYINSCKEKIKPEGLKKTRMVHPGDFLLTNSMSFGRPYITNIEGCIHDGWLMISPYANAFNQSYLYYVLASAFAYKQFCGKVAGAVVQNLNSDKVADSYVPLPPLAEQKRIVEKIEQLFKSIDKLNTK